LFASSIITMIEDYFNQTIDKFPEITEEFKKNSTLLIFMDRESDLPIMFHHSASFGALVNDIFGLSRTKVVKSEDKKKLNKFEIDPVTDYIWNENVAIDFPTTLDKIITDFNKLNEQTSFLDSKKTEEIAEISAKLNQTLDKVQDIIEKQNVLANHLNYADKLKEEIKLRKIEELYDFEFDLLSNRGVNNEIKKKYNKICTSSNHTNILNNNNFKYDVLRSLIIYYLMNKDLSEGEVNEIQKNLSTNFNVKTSAFEFLRQKKSF